MGTAGDSRESRALSKARGQTSTSGAHTHTLAVVAAPQLGPKWGVVAAPQESTRRLRPCRVPRASGQLDPEPSRLPKQCKPKFAVFAAAKELRCESYRSRISFLLSRQPTVEFGRPCKLRKSRAVSYDGEENRRHRPRSERPYPGGAQLGPTVRATISAEEDKHCHLHESGTLSFAATVLRVWNVKWLHKLRVPSPDDSSEE